MPILYGAGCCGGPHAVGLIRGALVPGAPRAWGGDTAAPADLPRYTLLSDDAHLWDPTFPDWDTWLSSLGVEAKLRIRRFSDSNLVIGAATASLGVALMWHSLVVDELNAGRLQRLFGSTLPTGHGYYLVVPPTRLQVPKIAAFRQWMLDQAQRQSAP